MKIIDITELLHADDELKRPKKKPEKKKDDKRAAKRG